MNPTPYPIVELCLPRAYFSLALHSVKLVFHVPTVSQPGEIINLSAWNVIITGRADKLLKGTPLIHESDSVSTLRSMSILHSRFARVFHMPTAKYDNISN